MTHQKYNGWHNYETWVVKLWMDNEEPSYRYWREHVEAYIGESDKSNPDWKHKAAIELSDDLKTEHESALPELEGFASDLLAAGFSKVNWYEIAESLINDRAGARFP